MTTEPGLRTPDPGKVAPPQLVEISTESGAVSVAGTWFPVVNVTLVTDDGAGITFSAVVGTATDALLRDIRDGARAARRDVAVARAKGII